MICSRVRPRRSLDLMLSRRATALLLPHPDRSTPGQ